MKPINFRDANFEALRSGLDESRARVYAAWCAHGPGTTRAVAHLSGIDLLTLRPRTTELLTIGLLSLVTDAEGRTIRRSHNPCGQPREGVYQATPQREWENWRDTQIQQSQQLLSI